MTSLLLCYLQFTFEFRWIVWFILKLHNSKKLSLWKIFHHNNEPFRLTYWQPIRIIKLTDLYHFIVLRYDLTKTIKHLIILILIPFGWNSIYTTKFNRNGLKYNILHICYNTRSFDISKMLPNLYIREHWIYSIKYQCSMSFISMPSTWIFFHI